MSTFEDPIRTMTLALSRFLAFFTALVASVTVVYTIYFWIVGSPVGDAWKVVGSLAVSAIVLFAFAIATAAIARVEGHSDVPSPRIESKSGTREHPNVA
jgi:hypothetical protein